jgi:molybdate transport system substrate-binding protein
MKRRLLLTGVLGLALLMGTQAPARPNETNVAIAAAGDLRGALDELKASFEARHPGIQLQLSFGASGNLTAQIRQGAPFDLFLSADTAFPESLRQAGLVDGDGLFPYATGSLTLWVRKDLNLDPARDGLKVLLAPAVKKIATANAKTAPYGRAGEAALRHVGLYEAVLPRLVYGDNIAQTAQFLQAGTAEAGLISDAQASNPALARTGRSWKVPTDAYPPIRQAGVILKQAASPAQARAFRAFLLGPEGQAILARHGFGRP